MKLLGIDPSSNKFESSTTGIALLENSTLLQSWAIGYGVNNFENWFKEVGQFLEIDQVVVEEYKTFKNDRARDNTTTQTMEMVLKCYPEAATQNNASYASDIPDALLKKLGLWEFEDSHHQDIRAAVRIALFWAMRNDQYDIIQEIGQKAIG